MRHFGDHSQSDYFHRGWDPLHRFVLFLARSKLLGCNTFDALTLPESTRTFALIFTYLPTMPCRKHDLQVFLPLTGPPIQVNCLERPKSVPFQRTHFLPASVLVISKRRCRRISTRNFPHRCNTARWQRVEHSCEVKC